jgi:hypothetical protein
MFSVEALLIGLMDGLVGVGVAVGAGSRHERAKSGMGKNVVDAW